MKGEVKKAMGRQDELLKAPHKIYVEVIVSFDRGGKMTPHRIRMENGEVYSIDKIRDARPRASLKAGGQGMRYTIVIEGRESFLFHEQMEGEHQCGRWFVEEKG